jgi:hypothetical protein
MGEEGRGDEGLPNRLNPKKWIVSVFLDGSSEKCEKIRV